MLSKPNAESSGGSKALHVDLEIEQIADRVRILGAIQAPQRRRAGVRLGARHRAREASQAANES